MLEVPGEQNEFELTQLAPVGSALFRLVKQLELVDFCANDLSDANRPVHHAITRSFFLVLGFSIVASSCEAMILAFKGAEYAADQRFTWW
jgi:hypothetical protein